MKERSLLGMKQTVTEDTDTNTGIDTQDNIQADTDSDS